MSGDASSTTSKISTYVLIIIYVILAMSIVAILVAINAFVIGQNIVAGYLFISGFIGMALAGYMLLQSRRRTMKLKVETLPTMTTVECRKCGTKTVREFQRGDFVYKELGPCQKCPDDKLTITSIYKEVKEKEKSFPF